MKLSNLRETAERIFLSIPEPLRNRPSFSPGVILLSIVAMRDFYRSKRLTPDQIKTRLFHVCNFHPIHRRHFRARVYGVIRGDPVTEQEAETLITRICSEWISTLDDAATEV